MKRLGIFVFYDASGIVDRYVEVLLQGMLSELQKLVIVVNGNITDESRKRIAKYSKYIYHRKNIGFDGGAYKDTLLDYLTDENWNEWDEIVLFNDTFYAPIFPWRKVFDIMEEVDADFWGLTEFLEGYAPILGKIIPDHVQSYFLVCRKNLINSECFWEFWNELNSPETHRDAIEKFEVRFTTYFQEKGFCNKTYQGVKGSHINIVPGTCSYQNNMYELLREIQIPIIKRKALTVANFSQAKRALKYIEKQKNYDVNLIYENLERLSRENRIGPFNSMKLESFYHSHERIFIYGHGLYGKNIAEYFKYKNWSFEGFLVSKKNDEDGINILIYEEMEFQKNDGIILALGRQAFSEVYPIINQQVSDERLFLPEF